MRSIGDNVMIGSDVIILPDIHIVSNVVIATGIIITKDILDNSVSDGVPAKVIGNFNNFVKKRADYSLTKLYAISVVCKKSSISAI